MQTLMCIIRSTKTGGVPDGGPGPASSIEYQLDITMPDGMVMTDQGPYMPHNDRPDETVIDTQPAKPGTVWPGMVDEHGRMFFTIVEREALCSGGG